MAVKLTRVTSGLQVSYKWVIRGLYVGYLGRPKCVMRSGGENPTPPDIETLSTDIVQIFFEHTSF